MPEYKKVFIIDDSSYTAMTMKKILTYLDYHVVGIATNIKDAISELEKHKQDLDILMLDIFLGDDNGVDLIPTIIKNKKNLHIIMVSSNTEEKVIVDCIKKGAKHYILKPFNIENIKKVLHQVLNE